MSTIVHISTLDLDALAPYARLTEAQLLNRLHPEQGLFICESLKVIRVALAHGLQPVSFLCEEKFLPQVPDCGAPVYTADRALLQSLTGYALSRGILCCMRRPVLPSVAEILASLPAGDHPSPSDLRISPQAGDKKLRVAVLDGVVNSENTGAIFRAAAALGIDALLLTRTCCDPLNRYDQLRHCGLTSVALALTDRSLPLDDPRLQGLDRIAIILGTEGDGLSDSVLQQADYVARIPMQRGVDSLNVAAAAAVAFWQLR